MIRWAKEKSKPEQLLIAYEATGAVSRPFTMQLIKGGIKWVCLFPPAVRAFARSVGKQVKTDIVNDLRVGIFFSWDGCGGFESLSISSCCTTLRGCCQGN